MTLVLLLFLALTASWTELVRCEEQGKIDPETGLEDSILEERNPIAGGGEDPENHGDVTGSGDETTQDNVDLDLPRKSDSSNGLKIEPTDETEEETSTGDLTPIIITIILLVLILIIIATIVCGVMIYRRRTKTADTNEDHYLDNEDYEKVPMPMFDDDIPSVMELEMEDLENWMAKDRGMTVDPGQI